MQGVREAPGALATLESQVSVICQAVNSTIAVSKQTNREQLHIAHVSSLAM